MVSDVLRVRVDELAARVNGKVEESLGELEITVDERYALAALTDAKNFADVPCDFLHDLCGMDQEDHLEVVYQLSSLRGPQRLRIIAIIERENPVIDSVTRLWKGADFLEREAFDMFGIQFRGHPNLKRIYMWDDFEGYPMRKDYVIESYEQRAVMRVRKKGNRGGETMMIEGTQEYALNMGPQHPSTHGVFRMVVHLDGEVVTKVEPKIGYLHRGLEKMAESRTYTQFIPYTDRLDYLAGPHNSLGYVQAVEKLMDIEVPERAEYLRVIFAELGRIASHLVMIGSGSLDISGWTPWSYCFRDRERILDLFEMTAGNRMTPNYFRIGGVSHDVPDEFMPALQSFLEDMPEMIEEYYGIFFGNEIAQSRMKSVGILPKELAENLLITGANLRASGVQYDVRKAEPYSIYDRFDFDIPVLYGGDTYDRHLIRLLEIQESKKILQQALRDIPAGPVMAKVTKVIKPPAGKVYHRVENPKGEMGWYIVSNGSTKPARVRIRTGAFVNVQMLPAIVTGWKIQDLVTIFASMDLVLGEVDK